MLTLYTAVGELKFNRNANGGPVPVIINNEREYGLSEHEFILWSCLAFHILTFYELRDSYQVRLKERDVSDGLDFSHYLNRLLLRGLIAKGDGMTGVNTLFNLIGTLHIVPLRDTFFVRLLSCICLFMQRKISGKDFFRYLRKEKISPTEKGVLNISKRVSLTTAELMTCIDRQIKLRKESDIVERLYTNPEDTYKTLAEDLQLPHFQFPVLQAISNLYLNKHISFHQF